MADKRISVDEMAVSVVAAINEYLSDMKSPYRMAGRLLAPADIVANAIRRAIQNASDGAADTDDRWYQDYRKVVETGR